MTSEFIQPKDVFVFPLPSPTQWQENAIDSLEAALLTAVEAVLWCRFGDLPASLTLARPLPFGVPLSMHVVSGRQNTTPNIAEAVAQNADQLALLDPSREGLSITFEPPPAPHLHGPAEGSVSKIQILLMNHGSDHNCQITFDGRCYSRHEIYGLADHLQAAWQRLPALFESGSMGDLSCATEMDLRRLEGWNATDAPVPFESLTDRIAFWAKQRPEAIAVHSPEGDLSYARLDRETASLAMRLIQAGAHANDLIGIHLQRGAEMVVAVLAIWKIGAAYVPLDPEYPPPRLFKMIADANVAILIQDSRQSTSLSTFNGKIIDLASPALVDELEPCNWHGSASDLAYVVYTSGSTGEPKGVLVSQGALWNQLSWMQAAYKLTPQDRVLNKAAFSFDVSVWEMVWPLANGAATVLAKPGGALDPWYLAQMMVAKGVTIAHFVPTAMRAMLAGPGFAQLSSLRLLLFGGESLSNTVIAELKSQCTAKIHNRYGPSEATIDVATYPVDELEGLLCPIGRPIWNTRLYLLDDDLRQVPMGCPGELYISGAGLAEGYLHQPALTASTFIACPFSNGDRMYRTGDIVRLRLDGILEYVGRRDNQVKIRGFRIELAEVEAHIQRLSGVKDAAAKVFAPLGEEPFLRAFLVLDICPPDLSALRKALSDTLPPYMLPSDWIVVESIPKTASGKIDRPALSSLAPEDLNLSRPLPAASVEDWLTYFWRSTAGTTPRGDADFPSTGATSLDAVRFVAMINQTWQVEFPLGLLYERATFSEIVEFLVSLLGE